MSCFTATCSPWLVDMHHLRQKVQESLDNGFDDDEAGIENLVRYYVNSVSKVDVEYMPSCRLYSVRFCTVDTDTARRFEYQYRFFVKRQ